MPRSNVTFHVVGMVGRDRSAWPPPVIDSRSAWLPPVIDSRSAWLPPVIDSRSAWPPPVVDNWSAWSPPVIDSRSVDQDGCTVASTTLVDARRRGCGKTRQLMDRARLARTTLLPAVSVILALAISGANHAYWGGSGGGTGSGGAGTAVAVSLSPGTPSATLLPGGQADVVLSISNPNTVLVHVGSLVLDAGQGTGGFAVDAGHSGCAVATLSFTTQTNGGAGWTVPAKVGAVDGALAVTLADALAMGVGAANACQGASATVYLAASP